jgi:hypothetical protein
MCKFGQTVGAVLSIILIVSFAHDASAGSLTAAASNAKWNYATDRKKMVFVVGLAMDWPSVVTGALC